MQMPNSNQEWNMVANEFFTQWQFPNCIGALDRKHIRIVPPPNSGSLYFSYKQYNSVVLMALVDACYKFLYVDIGSYGRISDGGVFNSCSLSAALESNTLNIPEDRKLPHSDIASPYVVVADDAFALKRYLMKPYASRNLTVMQRVYNYRFSRARRVVENAFGIMCSRFRVFSKAIPLAPDKVQSVVMAVCVIHNFLLRNPVSAAQYIPEECESTNELQRVSKQGGNRPTNAAVAVRDELCKYFSSDVGSVGWQTDAIK